MGGRARASLRKQEKLDRMYGPDKIKPLYARCFCCDHRFQVNNYEDGKPRLKKYKYMDKIICPWCMTRQGKQFVRLMVIAEAAAKRTCDRDDDCKCLVHSARRVLA